MNIKQTIIIVTRSKHQGFALPITLGLGLIMILIASTMIARSQGDQVTASAQKATNQSLSVAEIGITRYQSLINNNRLIAIYPRTGDPSAPSWVNASSIKKINNCPGVGASQVIDAATQNWRDVDSNDSSKGQYRLVEYVYNHNQKGVVLGTGTLTVEGRTNQANTGSTSTSKLTVNIPVVNEAINTPVAGLWLKDVTQNMGSNTIKGNILVDACSLPSGVSNSNVTTGYKSIANPNNSFPDAPGLPTFNLNTIPVNSMSTRIWNQTLPKVGDLAQADGSYHYLIQGDLSQDGGANITISNAKIVFYVQGNINIGGSASINQTSYPQNLQIYGNTFQRNSDGTIKLDASNKPLTQYGCPAGLTLPVLIPPVSDPSSYNTNCPTISVSRNSSGSIKALIHASDATGNIASSGTACNTSVSPPTGGGFIGTVWVKKLNQQTNSGSPIICAYGNYSDYNSTRQTSRPSIPSISSWQRQ